MTPFLTLLYLSSGLFLGWNLGANDAANILGTAVGSRMLSFRRAAIIGAVFVLIGSVAGGLGGSLTLGKLGSIGSLSAAFTVALSAAFAVFLFTRSGLPVSTSQAIVGAIIGWNLFAGLSTDWGVMLSIAGSWVASPILAALISIILYYLFRKFFGMLKMHLFYWDVFLRFALAAAGAYGAYSLGANNIANVMGVFVQASPLTNATLGPLSFSGAQVLFFFGGIAIGAGILTYSKKVMETVGADIYHLSPENALVAVIAVSTVLLLFTSPWLPRVPVSSSQAAVGAVMGIGLARGARNMKYDLLGKIALGWLLTPLASGILSFLFLSIMKNLFEAPL